MDRNNEKITSENKEELTSSPSNTNMDWLKGPEGQKNAGTGGILCMESDIGCGARLDNIEGPGREVAC